MACYLGLRCRGGGGNFIPNGICTDISLGYLIIHEDRIQDVKVYLPNTDFRRTSGHIPRQIYHNEIDVKIINASNFITLASYSSSYNIYFTVMFINNLKIKLL